MSSMPSPDLLARARPGVRELSPYQPGMPVEELERELGIHDAIKLASNENPRGAGGAARAALTAAASGLGRYPDGGGFHLKAALAEHHGLDPAQVTLGNGSNEVLELAVRVFAGPGDEVLFSAHCFTVYPLVTLGAGATPVRVPARAWGHDLGAMAAALTPRTRVVFIANPNNPTGTWVGEGALGRFLAVLPADVLVVLDEAYFEYAVGEYAVGAEGAGGGADERYPDGSTLLAAHPNLLVTRTFSKVHGLAALRIGYALSSAPVADLMNRLRQPFNVNQPAMAAALAALRDVEHVEASVVLNRAGMRLLEGAFGQLGIEYVPSAGNFITFDTAGLAAPVYAGLLREGVIVRPVAGYDMPAHLRVTIGTEAQNQRFLDALVRVLEREGRR